MSASKPMTALRRPMPGMPVPVTSEHRQTESPVPGTIDDPEDQRHSSSRSDPARSGGERLADRSSGSRRESSNYATTRLANFRLPVDLHDDYRELVREVEKTHPRLRRPSLTEVIVALLEEGPRTTNEVAELLRRRRSAENQRGTRS